MSASGLAEYPFQSRFMETGGGHRQAYLDEGEGPTIVMVHGNPSWSYLYRNLVAALRDRYRCIAPDHLGCGFSDKPAKYPYRLSNHIDNLEHLLDALAVERCILVIHDWGGAIGMGWAGRHPERVAGVVVLNTAAFPSSHIPWRIAICRWPILGTLLVRGLNGFARAAVSMAVHRPMLPAIAAGFLAPYDSWAHRIAVHRFVVDIPMDAGHPSWESLIEVEQLLPLLAPCPMLVCWGGRDFCFHDAFFEEWIRRFPEAESHYFPDAGHYVLEDGFAEILPLIRGFLKRTMG